ncbi:MAG TPA: class I SAM-dependent methyltransferase [Nitrolancea sp.]|jgi:ubiquinone/menaquinone biosynthesis C-methylase UbiE|nr:class I SAM-dependent methyltransferase [Nitrolancea sp.]
MVLRGTSAFDSVHVASTPDSSLFERVPWLYVFLRERVFRDDTARIIASLWPDRSPVVGTAVLELGCGPGFYARRLAKCFPEVTVWGIDRSMQQLNHAVARATASGLSNCHFEPGDAQAIARASNSVDVVVASRLFTILPDPKRALAESHRVLRPGGRCFVSEPRPHMLARIPLRLMWAAAGIANVSRNDHDCYREPSDPCLLDLDQFRQLISTQNWSGIRVWADNRYQYAVCTKA